MWEAQVFAPVCSLQLSKRLLDHHYTSKYFSFGQDKWEIFGQDMTAQERNDRYLSNNTELILHCML